MRLRDSLADRLKAALLHLTICGVVGLCAAALIFIVWYPAPLSGAQGVGRMALVLIGVDVAIGPLITLIVFDRGKKSLKFDLCVVAALQLAALLYGLHAIHIARPALVVFNVDRFDVVPAVDVDPDSLAKSVAAGNAPLSWWHPRVVAARIPSDRKQRNALLMSAIKGGPDLPQLPEFQVPYESEAPAVLARARPLAELREVNRLNKQQWKEFLHSLRRPESELAYLPLRGKSRDGAVVIDRASAKVIKIVLMEPSWGPITHPDPAKSASQQGHLG
ncbi:MAG TPA: TfpX/TfpZ family type IV pilin accessory protein [Solimonas sp.]|nr:TfpX/TfpZ family type IV pilin accessory protein [Solimonas sp.]